MKANKSQIDKFGLNFATQANARKPHNAEHICKAVKVMDKRGIYGHCHGRQIAMFLVYKH